MKRAWTETMPGLLRRVAPLTLVTLAAAGTFAGYSEKIEVDGDSLTFNNLIGEIRVEYGRGDSFLIEIDVQGQDAERGAIDIDRDGDEISLVFPRSADYVYPRLGKNSRSTISERGGRSGWMRTLGEMLGRDKVTIRGSGRGMELWADVTITMPSGGEIEVANGIGDVFADGLEGDVSLMTRSGQVEVSDIRGELMIDTGSGSVAAEDIEGDVSIDTGSGTVTIRNVDGDDFVVDTGSGRVIAEDIFVSDLEIDTGSGSVKAVNVAADNAVIDTGSGSVVLELREMGDGEFVIDTGSGGVDLLLPPDASARIQADTGSGGVRLDLPRDVDIRRKERDEVYLIIGSGAATISIDTGSGGVKIRQR